MEEKSALEELWEIKDEIASQYASFAAYVEDMFRLQSEAHPEFTRYEATQTLAHA